MPRFSLVLFDLDGTLVDTAEDIAAALNATLVEAGWRALPTAAVIGYVGNGAAKLIERALLGGVRAVHGTDTNPDAIAIASHNFAAAKVGPIEANFSRCDFRAYAASGKLKPNSATLILTNPPLGMRVPVNNLRKLIGDLFTVAGRILRPGGRLVFASPLSPEDPPRAFRLVSRQSVDFGGFDCRIEKYVKQA